VNVTAPVSTPLHTTWSTGLFTIGVGFTVIVKLCTGPEHVTAPNVYLGVTVIVATTGAAPAFNPANAAMFPVPVAKSPIEGVSFTQS
jgi:hypothetical protein